MWGWSCSLSISITYVNSSAAPGMSRSAAIWMAVLVERIALVPNAQDFFDWVRAEAAAPAD